MTAAQKIKHLILIRNSEWNAEKLPEITPKNIDEVYKEAEGEDGYGLQDARDDIRSSGINTKLDCPFSRHFESEAVAMQAPDGTWVGWTYWYGGGKHAEPEAIDWIEDAYDVECTEEQKTVTVYTFTKPK
jgi:hypothetical protein